MTSRPRELARNLVLGVSTAAGMAAEDPSLLVVQAARRLPARVRGAVVRLLLAGGPSLSRRAVGAWLAGHDGEARELLGAALAGARPGGHPLLAEIGVLLDVPGAEIAGSRAAAARAALRRGEVSGAVDLARGTPLAARFASERCAMTPGHELRTLPPAPVRAAAGPAPRALHVLTNSFPHTPSGYAVRSHEVLLAQRRAGVAVEAVTRVGYPITVGKALARHRDVVDGVGYSRLVPWRSARTPGARLQQQLEELRPLARRYAPSVLHTTTNYTNALVTRALARELGVPWVYEARGVLEDTWVASFPPHLREAAAASEKHALLRARELEVARSADRVVTLSEVLREELVARGVPRERTRVVPNGVDGRLLQVREAPAAARRALGLPGEGFWVGTVSSLVAYEGLDTLLRAVALVRAEGVDVRAALVGDGVSAPGLRRLSEELGVQEAVSMPGRVSTAQAERWYLALDAFAVPRVDSAVTRSVTPLKPVTAMALGRPVIASDLPALREVTGGAGLYTRAESPESVAEAILRLARSEEVREERAAAGRAEAATRTWDSLGARYRAMYEEVVPA